MRRCECCTEYVVSVRPRLVKGTNLSARLCDTCANAGHGRDQCLVCGEYTWHCARVAHMSLAHPLVLEKLANDPMTELAPKPPRQRYLGQIRFR